MKQNNTITHIEIPAPDLEKAIEFYSRVFNWEIQIIDAGRYAFFKIGDTNTGGGLDAGLRVAEERQGAQIVVDVEDIEVSLKEIALAGGNVTIQKTAIGESHGFYAGFQDPNGNHLQIHSRV
jgi:predicted enzyme related to lactoylglutathione lyase